MAFPCFIRGLNMINPTFSDVITLYHQSCEVDEQTKRTVTKWSKRVFKDCYFGTREAESVNGTTLSLASSYVVRIPHNGLKVVCAPGDIVVYGSVEDIVDDVAGQRVSDLLAKYKPNAFTVRAVSYNTKIPCGAHYKLSGV